MHQMVFKEHPFENKGKAVELAIFLTPYTIPTNPNISPEYKDMLKKCLEKDPFKRITAEELSKHPCFRGQVIQKPNKPVVVSLINHGA